MADPHDPSHPHDSSLPHDPSKEHEPEHAQPENAYADAPLPEDEFLFEDELPFADAPDGLHGAAHAEAQVGEVHAGDEQLGEHDAAEHLDFDVAPDASSPLSALGLGSSIGHGGSDEFDFSEPTDFAFPGSESNAPADGSLLGSMDRDRNDDGGGFNLDDLGGEEHPGATTDIPEFGADGSVLPGAEVAEAEAVADAEVEEAPKPEKKRRKVPPFVRKTEIALLILVPIIALVLNIISIKSFDAPAISMIWHGSYVALILLIPYVLWRYSKTWTKLRITASYTMMLALAVACLLTCVWMMGIELATYDWAIIFKKPNVKSPITSVMPERTTYEFDV